MQLYLQMYLHLHLQMYLHINKHLLFNLLARVAAALAPPPGRTLPHVAFIKFDLCALSILKIIYKFYQIWYFFSLWFIYASL